MEKDTGRQPGRRVEELLLPPPGFKDRSFQMFLRLGFDSAQLGRQGGFLPGQLHDAVITSAQQARQQLDLLLA